MHSNISYMRCGNCRYEYELSSFMIPHNTIIFRWCTGCRDAQQEKNYINCTISKKYFNILPTLFFS